jgi:hypothetical protein
MKKHYSLQNTPLSLRNKGIEILAKYNLTDQDLHQKPFWKIKQLIHATAISKLKGEEINNNTPAFKHPNIDLFNIYNQ